VAALKIFPYFEVMKYLLLPVLILIGQVEIFSQAPAIELLDKSIAYHDPDDRWKKWAPELPFTVVFPGKPDTERWVSYDNKKGSFLFRANYPEGDLVYKVEKDSEVSVLWNDSAEIPEKVAEQYRISKDRALMYRDYYTYLYGMPMKLNDPGTNIHPEISTFTKEGVPYKKIKVSYEESIGKDIWYFYFDPITSALKAYQFFKDESKNDGEFILFEGEIIKDGIRIPKDRKWYYNVDGKYLATDVLQ